MYINDILVYSRTEEEHAEHLCTVLKTLEEHKLYTKFKKCDFCMEKVHFLGHVISREGVSVDPAKVEAVVNWVRPTNLTEACSFLRMAGYYRRFVEGFFEIALPLTKLLRKDNKFTWTEDCEVSFLELKQCLVSALILTILMVMILMKDLCYIVTRLGKDWDVF